MRFRVVIPARWASTRLPGKPLADIGGKPMVVRVADAAVRSGAVEVWIATDHAGVIEAAAAHGHRALMTRVDHASGTDRLAEVATQQGWLDDDIVVNVQGDEPLIDPALIFRVATALARDEGAVMATVAHPLTDIDEFFNPNIVKVVIGENSRALYFSRAPIPWPRDFFTTTRAALPADFAARRHVGIYAYRVGFLRHYSHLPPTAAEQWESLEQLRALCHGYAIHVVDCTDTPAVGVDTPEDLARVRRQFDPAPD